MHNKTSFYANLHSCTLVYFLTENPITEKGLGYLTCFKALQKLDISRTNVTVTIKKITSMSFINFV